jgi:predicted ATPase
MLKSLKIENFRGFESFELKQLGRINLLVGENNSGKTSILEALLILLSRVTLEFIAPLMLSRGEVILQGGGSSAEEQIGLDIKHLFHDRQVEIGSQLVIEGRHDRDVERLTLAIQELMFDTPIGKFDDQSGFFDDGGLELRLQWLIREINHTDAWEIQNRSFQLLSNTNLPLQFIRRSRRETNSPSAKTQFIPAESISVTEMFRLFEDIQLTPQEELIYQALRTIEPKCERIAGKPTHNRFEVKLSDQDQPIPLGSMGDGMSRILRLALGLANAKGGVLLVDEIDTGLHFMAMTGMWKMLWEACNKLDIQIFATTHSRDCWESLTEVAEWAGVQDHEILLHRIEPGKKSSVAFNPSQMTLAAERGIEVR